MLLSDLADQVAAIPAGAGVTEICSLTADSRAVAPGSLFAALPGTRADGSRFVEDAIAKGAVAILAGEAVAVPAVPVPVVRAADPRRALALMAARLYAPQPATAVAVTGTNGKTSVAEFARQIFARLGRTAASLGTIGVVKPDGSTYGSLTTPDPVTLHRTLAALAQECVTHLAFEASSHGLDQRRLDGVAIKAAAFTNLGRDHLDYHPTVDDYFHAKLRLFDTLLPADGVAVIHADDDRSQAVAEVVRRRGIRIISTGRNGGDLRLAAVSRDGFAQRLEVEHGGRRHHLRLRLIGDYQATNALLAAGLAIAAGENAGDAIAAIEAITGVNGRLDIVGEHDGGLAVVDYAHKPEALAAALGAVRPFATGKLICVFGCGGDRDKGKRPIMGGIAAANADIVIVTDDNPRSEQPAAIRQAILANAPGAIEIGDRAAAIRQGVALLQPGDVLLVAGKGHETGQIVGATTLPFSDHEAVRAAMAKPALWTVQALVAASGGTLDGTIDGPITGISIDTRSLSPGDLFAALKDARDGHDFVTAAFKAGAAAAIVATTYDRRPGDGALLRVDDPLRALERIGVAARDRLSPDARVIAVTGSAGKTGTKEMLRQSLSRAGKTHAAVKSFNNHWGVPLTLARMPADTRYGVFEIGMSNPDEITPLVRLVRPHAGIVTTVEPVHLAQFASVEAIADAKSELFAGILPGGVAIINRDNPHYERLKRNAQAAGVRTCSFGWHDDADVRIEAVQMRADGSTVQLRSKSPAVACRYALGAPGAHVVQNSAAVAAALLAIGVDADKALQALQSATAPEGRGARKILAAPGGSILLIDESYNANPASMRSALDVLGTVPRSQFPRRVAVLGDMLELGPDSAAFHRGLAAAVEAAGVDLVFTCGRDMRHLFDRVASPRRGGWAPTSADLEADLVEAVRAGDAVMIKGSLGSRMAPLVKALQDRFPGGTSTA
jgi:UDP-N-acetylmuramyl-tripeptide synthetase/UDP-N-acetylmuramoyl-tripeptide--D-alanyl-D-alanine ligase